ncbi:MAG: DUF3187 family protein [Leptospira sp.]|nr:DUF3187 family protein [Leptospira sp.]
MKFKSLWKILLLFLAFPYVNPAGAEDKGPLEVRNNFPLFLLFMNPLPESANTMQKGNFSLLQTAMQSNTSIYSSRYKPLFMQADLEVTRLSWTLNYALSDRIEIGAEIPAIYLSKGVMDSGIHAFHLALGLPDSNRGFITDYSFNFKLYDYANQLIDVKKPTIGVGDATFKSKIQILKESDFLPSLSLSPAIKAPTGKLNNGTGSGKADYGSGILLKKSFGPFSIYLNIFYIKPGEAIHSTDVALRAYTSTTFAVEYHSSETLSIILQANDLSSPYRSSDPALNGRATEFSFGFKQNLNKKTIWQLSFTEDLTHQTTPDIGFNFSLRQIFD